MDTHLEAHIPLCFLRKVMTKIATTMTETEMMNTTTEMMVLVMVARLRPPCAPAADIMHILCIRTYTDKQILVVRSQLNCLDCVPKHDKYGAKYYSMAT